ncbi:MAG: hydantoinase B/oxoprolinase family protein [Myxococcota bacterium]
MFRWHFWIDRGGTFTDCIGVRSDTGEMRVAKVLSSDAAPLKGIRKLLDLKDDAPIPPSEVRMGTTVATNALLERKGAPTAFIVTHGFEDILRVGTQARPDLFALEFQPPSPLYRSVFGLPMRQDRDGQVAEIPDTATLDQVLTAARNAGCRSLAVVGLHAYLDGTLERSVRARAQHFGFDHISISSETAPEIGLVARGDTTVVDAYCTPLLRDYLQGLASAMPGSRIRLMQSSGGLSADLKGKDAVLSGPAGGVVAVGALAQRLGVTQAIGFDMGGTSTDVCRWAGAPERRFEAEVSGVRLRAPMMAIHTVAAGGGSICRFDGARYTVGPESAGSTPGPLCYGDPAASTLTLTDAHLILGRVRPELFPFPLAADRAERALMEVSREARPPGGEAEPAHAAHTAAEGFFRVATASMAEAIRQVTVARGHDVRDHVLMVFGGAGGQTACALARQLGIEHVVVHPLASVFSAWGMGLAPVRWDGVEDGRELEVERSDELEDRFRALTQQGESQLAHEPEGERYVQRWFDLRYRGTDYTLPIPCGPDLRRRFDEAHELRFGYRRNDHPVSVAAIRVSVECRPELWATEPPKPPVRRIDARGRLFLDGAFHEVRVLHRAHLPVQEVWPGPLVVVDDGTAVVVEPDFSVEKDEDEILHLRSTKRRQARAPDLVPDTPDPVQLEILANAFMSVAEQMGAVLQNTAVSTNIRERRDYSCAVFDAEGRLVANAPHIPVHLGAMGQTVKAVLAAHPDARDGDVFVSNDPYAGGSHLPDVTVVTPVFLDDTLRFVVASRGHHADIGGITPGSMPPFSSRLDQEGVIFRNDVAVRGGAFLREALLQQLSSGPHPARRPQDNLADFEAKVAANRTGAQRLLELARSWGMDFMLRYMDFVRQNAADQVRTALADLGLREATFADALDDGTPLAVRLRYLDDTLDVDFQGTGAAVSGNLNAPEAVTVAAVLYVLRCLVGRPIPLNDGCLEPVRLHLPKDSLLSPPPGRAVCGGNVETSQRIVDVLLGALGRAAASQGTMNNVTFGNERFGYYETIGGGAGATPHGAGASGIHTHMTNTRITDPEVLERAVPVWLRRFGLRRGSGGNGRWSGGDGLIRTFEFREPVVLSLLTERRARPPFGLAGGGAGATGVNRVNGREVPAKGSFDLRTGDRLEIQTPGGGGWGKAGV